jgi:hypothetical protein
MRDYYYLYKKYKLKYTGGSSNKIRFLECETDEYCQAQDRGFNKCDPKRKICVNEEKIDKIGIRKIPDDVARDRYYNESLEEYENTKPKEEEGGISIFGKPGDYIPRFNVDNDDEDEDLYT